MLHALPLCHPMGVVSHVALRSISYLIPASTLLPRVGIPILLWCYAPPRQVYLWYTISGVVLLRVTGPLHTYTYLWYWYDRIPISGHPHEVVHLVGGHGYHAMGYLPGGLLRSIYVYILLLAIRYWWVDHPLLLLQVLRTLHRMSYTIPQDTHSADISTSSARSSLC